MADIKGRDIREVWDYRLSWAVPHIDRTGGTWVVKVYPKDNADGGPPLEEYDTGIKFEEGDEYDTQKICVCYEWLLSVRDKYALDDIEERKPLVAKINEANAELAAIGATK